jgi:hypothetical protein
MPEPFAAFDAFIQEHAAAARVESGWVWMPCGCDAELVRRADED